jgi:rhodanese-related sulfurtransferase
MIKTNPGRRSLPLVLSVALFLLVSACSTSNTGSTGGTTPQVGKVVKTEKGQYVDLTAEELKGMMDNKDFFHVDVHIPHEGKMPQLDARIPYDEITQQLDKLPGDKAARIVLTCKSGGMSTDAATKLADLGYSNVYNLTGVFTAWKAAGYEFTPEP